MLWCRLRSSIRRGQHGRFQRAVETRSHGARFQVRSRKRAKWHDWNVSTYSSHENGQTDPVPQRAAKRYAQAFNVSELWLLTGHGSMEGPHEVSLPTATDRQIEGRDRPSATTSITGTAKLFTQGSGQAVHLPEEFRLPGKAVRVRQNRPRVLLEPDDLPFDVKAWFDRLDTYLDDPFMAGGREQPAMPPPAKSSTNDLPRHQCRDRGP